MRWPAEWEPHELTLMGWPCRTELWGETMDQARSDYAAVANAIADFEPVRMIANPGRDAADARAACAAGVSVIELGLDDSWLRDCGPIYVLDGASRRGVHFRFNAWGEKFASWDRDAAVGGLVVQALGDGVVTMLVLFGSGAAGEALPGEVVKGGYTNITLGWGLAAGDPSSRLTREADASLRRLEDRARHP